MYADDNDESYSPTQTHSIHIAGTITIVIIMIINQLNSLFFPNSFFFRLVFCVFSWKFWIFRKWRGTARGELRDKDVVAGLRKYRRIVNIHTSRPQCQFDLYFFFLRDFTFANRVCVSLYPAALILVTNITNAHKRHKHIACGMYICN